MILTATIRDDKGRTLDVIELRQRIFSTNKKRWWLGHGEVEIDGLGCPCQAQVVVIESWSSVEAAKKEKEAEAA